MKFTSACIITPNYPRPRFIEYGSFVEKHVKEWEELGVNTSVIAPISLSNYFRALKNKKENRGIAGSPRIYPYYLSYSNRVIGSVDLGRFSRSSFLNATKNGTKQLKSIPDLFYGKFLLRGGIAALEAGARMGRPAFVDLGESRLLENLNRGDLSLAKQIVSKFGGIVCVSKRLRAEAIELGASEQNVLLAPNTVDLDLFRPMDQKLCRKKLQLPTDQLIVIFVGHFIERKGPHRVLNALTRLNNKVKGVFLGRGEYNPSGQEVIYTGAVPNNELPIWLNAADMFVLPTLAEGDCNAIHEAMACGLPIISSDIPDIHDQVPENTGILINPESINELAEAIAWLMTNSNKRWELGINGRELAVERHKVKRSKKVIDWIEKIILK